MSREQSFVCAINRNRDGYQVPLALQERGLLASFVSDFYAPDGLSGIIPSPLQRRRVEGLPSSQTKSAASSFLVQAVGHALRLPMNRVFTLSDRLLARVAGSEARRLNAHLYCYSRYLPAERAIKRNTKRIVFEYHPLPDLSWELLQEDRAKYPQVEWSFAQERRELKNTIDNFAWKRADAISCASSMTMRSLIYAGCDPNLISVIPYGFNPPEIHSKALKRSEREIVEFLFVGQGIQRKGLHHLIEAWQMAGLAHARLTLVCYYMDEGIRGMVTDPSIRILSRQSRDELDNLYLDSDIFVMPSLVEGFGLVYLEALARGCHVIGSQNSGLPDLSLPDTAATILEPGDIRALADALVERCAEAKSGAIDHAAIAEVVATRSWAVFRKNIADHACSIFS